MKFLKLNKYEWKVTEQDEEDFIERCPICYGSRRVNTETPYQILPCTHILCINCIKKIIDFNIQVSALSLIRHFTCPMCRAAHRCLLVLHKFSVSREYSQAYAFRY